MILCVWVFWLETSKSLHRTYICSTCCLSKDDISMRKLGKLGNLKAIGRCMCNNQSACILQVRYHAAPLLLNIMPTESTVFQVIAGKRKPDGVAPLPLKRPYKAHLIFEINHPEPCYCASAAPSQKQIMRRIVQPIAKMHFASSFKRRLWLACTLWTSSPHQLQRLKIFKNLSLFFCSFFPFPVSLASAIEDHICIFLEILPFTYHIKN